MKDDKNKKISPRDKYLKDLKALIKDVPDEGLLFLIKQAGVLIYNAEAEKQNQAMLEKSNSKEKSDSKAKSQTKKKNDTRQSDSGNIVKLEKGIFGKSIIMTIGSERKTFGENEINALAKLVNGSSTIAGGCHRIFEWLKNNRNDVLLDAGIKTKDSPEIKGIFKSLKKA